MPAAEVRLYAPYLVAEVETRGGDMRTAVGAGFRSIAGFIFGKNEAAPGGGKAGNIAMTSPVTLELPSEAEAAAPRSEAVAMTSPVTAEMAGDGTYKARRPPARPPTPGQTATRGRRTAPLSFALPAPRCLAWQAPPPPRTDQQTQTPLPECPAHPQVTFIMPSKYTKDTLPRPLNPDVHIKEMPSRTMAALTWNGRSPREPQARCAALGRLGTACARQRGSRPAGLGLYQSSSSVFRFRNAG